VGSQAVVLAGGLGTRLRSVVADRPKSMALVKGRPYLAYLLDQLVDAQVSTVVLCTGYGADEIWRAFGNVYRDLSLLYSHEQEPLGTAGALRLALPLLGATAALVMNGDSFFNTDLEEFQALHRERQAEGSLLLAQVPDSSRYGLVHTDPADVVIGFDEKGGQGRSGWVNAGVYLLERSLLESIPAGMVSLENVMFPQWASGGRLRGYRTKGCRFLDIGTPESYAEAQHFFTQLEG